MIQPSAFPGKKIVPVPFSPTRVPTTQWQLQHWLPASSSLRMLVLNEPFTIQFKYTQTAKVVGIQLRLKLNDIPLSVVIDRTLLTGLLGALTPEQAFSSVDFEQIPDALKLTLVQASLASFADQLHEATGIVLVVDAVESEVAVTTGAENALLLCHCKSSIINGLAGIWFSPEILTLCQNVWPVPNLLPAQTALSTNEIPLHLSVSVKGPTLTLAQFEDLSAHDIILFNQTKRPAQVEIWCQNLQLGHALLDNDVLTITQLAKEAEMDEELALPLETRNYNLSELPFEIVFELASIKSTLAEIQAFAPGQLIKLNKPLTGQVTLKLQGHAFAQAELVEIAGQLGARITTINGSSKRSEDNDHDQSS